MSLTSAHPSFAASRGGIFPAGLVGSFRTNDFDELAAIPPLWDQQYSQLGHGPFRELFMAHTAQMVVGKESWAPGVMIRGSIPRDTVMFALPTRISGPAWHRGEELTSGSAILLFDDEEIDFRTASPFSAIVVAVGRDLFERRAQALTGHPLEALRHGERLIINDPSRLLRRLGSLLLAIESHMMHDAAPLKDAKCAGMIEGAFLEEVLRAVRVPSVRMDSSEKQRIAYKAEAILRGSVRKPISIFQLCDALGTSERTLHAAFREQLGMTPKAYLKMLRLNAAHHDLRFARPGTKVTDVAMRWDFLHFGWFAHDYLTMFGESPSATLHRAT